jgi:alpha-galactosidase
MMYKPSCIRKMTNCCIKKFFLLLVFSLVIGVNAQSDASKTKDWSGITVQVYSNQKVVSSQTLKDTKAGKFNLDVTFSNKTNQTAVIDSIEIKIPLAESISAQSRIAYGSSSMGSRHLLVQNVAKPTNSSYSYMYAMLQQNSNQYVFAAALSWRKFLPVISFKNNSFVIRSTGQIKLLKPGESIQYERIMLGTSSDSQDVLDSYATAIAAENGIEKVKNTAYKGWATWDYYAYKFSDKDIYENIDLIKKIDPTANLIQIDAGWYTQRGDFANSRADLPGGMKAIADKIKATGMIPGVWIDGFRANTDSNVFKSHPEFFLHDNEGNVIVQNRRPAGPDKDRVYMDYSHPGARAHMVESIRVITQEMGIPYIKVDFVALGLNDEILAVNKNFKSIKPFDASFTDVERLRLGLKTIRDAAPKETYILGCSGVFGPMIGFVDGMRTGGDISPRFEAFPERVLANGGNSYLNGKVFSCDADYIVLREAADEDQSVAEEKVKNGGSVSLNEAQMWADFTKLYGKFKLSSDKLLTLRDERKAILKNALEFPVMDETVPVDFWQHGKDKADGYELLLSRKGKDIYLGVFNWSDTAKEYNLEAFGSGKLKVEGRNSKIIKYRGTKSFTQVRKNLSAQLLK